jgi:hypothetical protein
VSEHYVSNFALQVILKPFLAHVDYSSHHILFNNLFYSLQPHSAAGKHPIITNNLLSLQQTLHQKEEGIRKMMYNTKLSVLGTAILALAPAASGHMILANPVPFGDPDNSPLKPDGSDFPCKNIVSPVKTMNNWPAGSQQTLEFKGSATHEGGSCQLSVTKDKAPTAASVWKVILSVEGGCPLAPVPFTVPKEIPDGELTAAWTWFNKVGNREMYMNCAPITVSGGSSDSGEFDKLPDMAVANIKAGAGASCTTPPTMDFTFANPGKYKVSGGTGPFSELCGGAAAAPGGGSSGSPSAAPGSPSAAPGGGGGGNNGMYTPPAASVPVASPTASLGGAFIPTPSASSANGAVTSVVHTLVTVTASSGLAQSSQFPASNSSALMPPSSGMPSQAPIPSGSAPTPSSPVIPSQTLAAPSTLLTKPSGSTAPPVVSTPAAQPSQAPITPGAGGATGTCATDSQIVCNGETQFGICDHGKVVWQAVAPGTTCQNGAIAKRDYTHRAQRTRL